MGALDPNIQVTITILGAALCVGGWVLFAVGSRLFGIAIGMGLGFVFGQILAFAMDLHGTGVALVLVACSLLGAVGGLFLMRAATTLMFGLMGFLFGALLGRIGVQIYNVVENRPFQVDAITVGAILLTAVVVGLLALWLQKAIVVVITSYMGAAFLSSSVPFLVENYPWGFIGVFAAAAAWQAFLVTRLLDAKIKAPKPEATP